MSEPPSVIIVDDEKHVRLSSAQTLGLEGFRVATFARAHDALPHLSAAYPGMVISDIRMPGMDGMAFLERVVEIDPHLPVALITGHGDVALAVKAMRAGAYDFIEKPFEGEHLIEMVRRALEMRRLVLENRSLRHALAGDDELGRRLIGRSDATERLRHEIEALADAEADVLILGETGTGKELVARLLHDVGPRRDRPFVAINCGALPETIIESELFGHEPGAFTGAVKARIGKFEHAAGGTVFLDEIESMPLDLQIRLLRVLQERKIERLGSNREIPLDIRVLAATKRDLLALSSEGGFREDLYYRLGVVTLEIAPLRKRREDVALLFQHFLAQAATRSRREAPMPSADILAMLTDHDWPGNVREVRNAAERFALGLAPLSAGHSAGDGSASRSMPLNVRVDAFEKSLIEDALGVARGNVGAAIEALGLPRKTFYDKLKKHGLTRRDFARDEAL